MSVDVGVNGLAQDVVDIKLGVNNSARKVVGGWIGVNGVARKFWDPDPYIWEYPYEPYRVYPMGLYIPAKEWFEYSINLFLKKFDYNNGTEYEKSAYNFLTQYKNDISHFIITTMFQFDEDVIVDSFCIVGFQYFQGDYQLIVSFSTEGLFLPQVIYPKHEHKNNVETVCYSDVCSEKVQTPSHGSVIVDGETWYTMDKIPLKEGAKHGTFSIHITQEIINRTDDIYYRLLDAVSGYYVYNRADQFYDLMNTQYGLYTLFRQMRRWIVLDGNRIGAMNWGVKKRGTLNNGYIFFDKDFVINKTYTDVFIEERDRFLRTVFYICTRELPIEYSALFNTYGSTITNDIDDAEAVSAQGLPSNHCITDVYFSPCQVGQNVFSYIIGADEYGYVIEINIAVTRYPEITIREDIDTIKELTPNYTINDQYKFYQPVQHGYEHRSPYGNSRSRYFVLITNKTYQFFGNMQSGNNSVTVGYIFGLQLMAPNTDLNRISISGSSVGIRCW